jgi:hypothetical protein
MPLNSFLISISFHPGSFVQFRHLSVHRKATANTPISPAPTATLLPFLAFAAPVNITADEDVVLVVVIDEALADVVIELPGVTDHVDDELVITAATGVVEVVC